MSIGKPNSYLFNTLTLLPLTSILPSQRGLYAGTCPLSAPVTVRVISGRRPGY